MNEPPLGSLDLRLTMTEETRPALAVLDVYDDDAMLKIDWDNASVIARVRVFRQWFGLEQRA